MRRIPSIRRVFPLLVLATTLALLGQPAEADEPSVRDTEPAAKSLRNQRSELRELRRELRTKDELSPAERWRALRAARKAGRSAGRVPTDKLAPEGAQFQVNTVTTGYQDDTDVALMPNGDFVVVWAAQYGVGDQYAIEMQRYASDGSPIGGEMQVSESGANYRYGPAVATDGSGGFVVAWSDYYGPAPFDYAAITARRFSSDGSAIGGEFQVESSGTGYSYRPAVDVTATGEFVVSWFNVYDVPMFGASSYVTIRARRFDSDANPQAPQFQVNDFSTGYASFPDVAVLPDQGFLVVWDQSESPGDDSDQGSIQGRRFDSTGTATGPQFQINAYTTGVQYGPRVDADPSGEFMVAWHSYGSPDTDTDGYSIQAQRLDGTGATSGAQFQVNTLETGSQTYADVAFSGHEFLVVWQLGGSELLGPAGIPTTFGRAFDPNDQPLAGEFTVGTVVGGYYPRIDASTDLAVAAWDSTISPGDDDQAFSAQARRLVPSADLVVTKTDGAATAVPGGMTTYTITVRNQGPNEVDGAQIGDVFPAILTCSWTSVATGGATGNTDGSGTLLDTLYLPDGGEVVYTATCVIDASAVGSLVNTATVTSPIADANAGDESDTDADTLTPMADLQLAKSALPNPVEPGHLVVYTLDVTNVGPSASTGGQVVDALPAGLIFHSSADCAHAAGSVTCAFGTLLPGASQQLTFAALVDESAAGTTVTNHATVSGNEPDPATGNDAGAAPVVVGPGGGPAPAEIPTLGLSGLAGLASLLALAGLVAIRRRFT